MDLDDRMARARADYRALDPGAPGPVPEGRPRGRTAWVVGLAAAVVVALAGVAVAQTVAEDDPTEVRVAAPTTSGPPPWSNHEPAPADSPLVVEPPGPYTGGQAVTVRTPAPLGIGSSIEWCAIIAIDGQRGEVCDPTFTAWGAGEGDQAVKVVLPGRIFTPRGDVGCREPDVECRIVARMTVDGRTDRYVRLASGPIEVEATRPPVLTMDVRATGEANRFEVELDGLDELVGDVPGDQFSQLCSYATTRPDFLERGLWSVPSGDPSCDDGIPAATPGGFSDGTNLREIRSPMVGYGGRADCGEGWCFLLVSQYLGSAADAPGPPSAPTVVKVAAMVPAEGFGNRSPLPSIEVVDPQPLRVGQRVTLRVGGLPPGQSKQIGSCRVEDSHACGFVAQVTGSGELTVEVPDQLAGCGPGECYLELDSRGTWLPPLAIDDVEVVAHGVGG